MDNFVMKDMCVHLRKAVGYILAAILPAFALSSCVEEFNADIPSSDRTVVVVQGDIVNDTECSFSITFASDLNSTEIIPAVVKDLRIEGSDGTVRYEKGWNVDDGIHYVDVYDLLYDETYCLVFEVEMNFKWVQFKSKPMSPSKSVSISEVSFSESRGDGIVDILVSTEQCGDEVTYFKWTIDETWEVRSHYRAMWCYNEFADMMEVLLEDRSRGWKYGHGTDIMIASTATVDGNRLNKHKIYDAKRSDDRFNTLYRTRVRQLVISKEQYDYELARREMTSDMGGLFTPQPSELPSNITSADGTRAVGFVGVCSSADVYTKYIKKGELSEYWPPRPHVYPDRLSGTNYATQMIASGYLVYNYDNYQDETTWIEAWGVDVTVKPTRASLVRPYDWPEDED